MLDCCEKIVYNGNRLPVLRNGIGKELSTDGNRQPLPLDVRLQNLIRGWPGGQHGENLAHLHNQCRAIAGRENALLPARLSLIPELDSVSLARALRQPVQIQPPVHGRFDSALVPTGKADGPPDRFLLAIDASLPLRDQVALYAHAVGHLLLNYQNHMLHRGLNLDPDSGQTHVDWLAELRYVEARSNRNVPNREVLKAFPLLAELAEPPVESRTATEAATRELQQRLETRGWLRRRELLISPYTYTAGRVLTDKARRGRKYSIDFLLRASFSLPIAVVHAQRAGQTYEDGMYRVQDAALRVQVPFAYLVETNGAVHEFDYSQGDVPVASALPDFPTHADLVERWLQVLGLTNANERRILLQFYQQTKLPRYYQDTAINRALIALLQAWRGLRKRRILLTLATGTGKTLVAFQLLWKLQQSQAIRNVLFLADRGSLLGQAINKDFAPLKNDIWRGMGESKTSRSFLFTTYQWLTTSQGGRYRFEDYPPDYFDVVIVDECHRGSAEEDSQWRRVLEYFSPAVQIGLTATPLKNRDVQTHEYFGEAVYEYSLSRGINDGFLAPYRVRRVLIGARNQPTESNNSPAPAASPSRSEPDPWRDVSTNPELAKKLVMETASTMRAYTQAIAEHLALYLRDTDPRARTIVFCVDNEHAQDMRAALQQQCAGWIRPEQIVRIVNDDGAEGLQALFDFCSTTTPRPVVVTTSRLLSTGIDAPLCKNIVLARGVGSMVEFKQIIGRGTRLFEEEKTWFTILDYAGAMKHFFDPEFDGHPEFIVDDPLDPQPESAETTREEQAEPARAGRTDSPGEDLAEEQNQEEPPEPAAAEAEQVATYAYDIAPKSAPDRPVSEQSEAVPLYPAGPSHQRRMVREQQDKQEDAFSSANKPMDDMPAPPEQPGTQTEAGEPSAPPLPLDLLENELAAGHIAGENSAGNAIVVLDDIPYELAPDGWRLRAGNGPQWAQQALQDVVRTSAELRERWCVSPQREDLLTMLDEQAVPLEKLAAQLHLTEADPFDVLRQAIFNLPPLTRAERVARLRQAHQAFFVRFAASPLASQALDAILNWYATVSMAALHAVKELDVSKPNLLDLPALKRLGMPMNIGLAFLACGMHIEEALEELQRLLYSV